MTCTDSFQISRFHMQLVRALQRGRLVSAKQLFLQLQDAYRREQKQLSPKHPYHLLYAKGLHHRGMIALHTGNPWTARNYFSMSLTRQQRVFGKGHLAMATTWTALSLALARLGRKEQARRWQTRAHQALQNALGEGHFALAQSLQAAALLQVEKKASSKALQLQREAVDKLTKALGKSHPYVAIAQHNLGLILAESGQQKEASLALKAALKAALSRLPKGHYVRGAMRYNLGRFWVLEQPSPPPQARRYLQLASANLLQSIGMTRSFSRKAWSLLAATAPSRRPDAMIKAMDATKKGLSAAVKKKLKQQIKPLWLHQPLLLR